MNKPRPCQDVPMSEEERIQSQTKALNDALRRALAGLGIRVVDEVPTGGSENWVCITASNQHRSGR